MQRGRNKPVFHFVVIYSSASHAIPRHELAEPATAVSILLSIQKVAMNSFELGHGSRLLGLMRQYTIFNETVVRSQRGVVPQYIAGGRIIISGPIYLADRRRRSK